MVGAVPIPQDHKEEDHQKMVESTVTTHRTAAVKKTEVGVIHPQMKKKGSKEQLV